MRSSEYTVQMKQRMHNLGADLVGVANTEPLRQLKVTPENLLDGYSRAISLAIQLPVSMFADIIEAPTPIYASVYQTANRMLDKLAFQMAVLLQTDGFSALPVPASQIIDRKNWYGAISHKAVARMAGLGWQGKNLLLITPRYGSRVRLVTVLTDAPLAFDSPLQNRCGKCQRCREACPVGAIKGVNTEQHYANRNEALHFIECADKLVEDFAKRPEIGAPICGICVNVCPFGQKKKKVKIDA